MAIINARQLAGPRALLSSVAGAQARTVAVKLGKARWANSVSITVLKPDGRFSCAERSAETARQREYQVLARGEAGHERAAEHLGRAEALGLAADRRQSSRRSWRLTQDVRAIPVCTGGQLSLPE